MLFGQMWLGVLEQGLVYGLGALGVFITFRVLRFPDLTVDGTFPLGGAVAAAMITAGYHPAVATLVAVAAGILAGWGTGILHTRLRISDLLAGILCMTALYSVNLRVMGRANIPLLNTPSLLTIAEGWGVPAEWTGSLVFLSLAAVTVVVLTYFLHTELGLALRATGDNPQMIRSLGGDTSRMINLGLAMGNGLVAFSGALVAQYQGFADVGMGIGTIVAGLAAVIIGEALLKPRGVLSGVVAVMVGSTVYRLVIFVALRLGFAPTDLKLVTALLVIMALALPAWREVARYRSWKEVERRVRTTAAL